MNVGISGEGLTQDGDHIFGYYYSFCDCLFFFFL